MEINDSVKSLLFSNNLETIQLGTKLLLRKDNKLSRSHYKWINNNLDFYTVTRHGRIKEDMTKGWIKMLQRQVENALSYRLWETPTIKTLKITPP